MNGELIASLEPGRATTRPLDDMRWTLLVRAYLARYPDAYWANDDEVIDMSLVDDGEILLATTAFEHVTGPHDADVDPDSVDRRWARLPSESAVYESLAAAIVAGDASRFEPGESNLDWRLHLGPAAGIPA